MISRTVALVLLCLLATGCENLVARGHGGSNDDLDDVEVGITF